MIWLKIFLFTFCFGACSQYRSRYGFHNIYSCFLRFPELLKSMGWCLSLILRKISAIISSNNSSAGFSLFFSIWNSNYRHIRPFVTVPHVSKVLFSTLWFSLYYFYWPMSYLITSFTESRLRFSLSNKSLIQILYFYF